MGEDNKRESNYSVNIKGTPSETALKKVTNSGAATVTVSSNVVTIDATPERRLLNSKAMNR